ncbi:pyruvate ferredoxin oxidoreductase [Candidatus Geothermarchaeota archaeon]|nr:MAG: pyruvate ferredoxin oxidoreductase [Candidatus Geothermarchaeota archaeon]
MKGKQMVLGLNGDEAVAYGVKQCNVDVIAAYPITPQTIIVEKISEMVANGEIDAEIILAESEHSALSACVGASAAGARVFTATASQGLALMNEILYIASGLRLPIVMAVVNRALSAPINIHCDHSDTMSVRDSSWIQIYSEDAQEAYDSTIQAFKIAEDRSVLLPAMVTLDGFLISHTIQNVTVLPDKDVLNFVGEHRAIPEIEMEGEKFPLKLDPERPLTFGPLDLYDYYFEHKRQQEEAIKKALSVIKRVNEEFSELSGRRYGNGLVEEYKLEDAEVAIVNMGSAAGTTKYVVDKLRKRGLKVGLLRIRTFRPFPADDIVKILSDLKAVAVMDRSMSFGALGGQLFIEIRNALYDLKNRPLVINYIYGLGGRDVPAKDIKKVFEETSEIAKRGFVKKNELIRFLGLRE